MSETAKMRFKSASHASMAIFPLGMIVLRFLGMVLTIESLTTVGYQRKLCHALIGRSWVFELFIVNITAT